MENVMQIAKLRSAIIGFLFVLSLGLLLSCSKNVAEVAAPTAELSSSANSSNNGHENNSHVVPFETTIFIPCANGGAGEDVSFTGNITFVYQYRWNNNGFSIVYHETPNQVKGTGVTSGTNYVASGGTNGVAIGTWVSEQWVATTNSRLRVVGPDGIFTVNYKYHLTVLSDGSIAVKKREETVDCN